jgi:hypothetical protein
MWKTSMSQPASRSFKPSLFESPVLATCFALTLSACGGGDGGSAAPTASTGGISAPTTVNLLGREWQAPQRINGTGSVSVLPGQPAFEAGLADDGHAFVVVRQPDANGRLAVQVIQGQAGAAGQSPTWTAPQVLDANAPLIATGNFRPRLAVSGTGHAVVAWLTELPCEVDSYESSPAGKTCRYMYASRRLASDAVWEPAKRVRASPPMAAQDHYVQINALGDVVITFPSFYFSFVGNTLYNTTSAVAIRHAADADYRVARLAGFWTNAVDTTPFAERIFSAVDDAGNLFVAGQSGGPFDLAELRTTTALAADLAASNALPVTSMPGSDVYQLQTSGAGFAAYTWRNTEGDAAHPSKMTVYSPTSQQWLTSYDIKAYTQWGDSVIVGTDAADGEFLLYSGCKVTAWTAGTWGTTHDLPADCGGDQPGGLYAFNRKGDYLGIDWAGRPGQWGYYSHAQDKLLKGSPGGGATVSGDFVLGTASDVFSASPTQLLLAPNGLALVVTTNAFTAMPSPANPAGVQGAAAGNLWAVYLK